MRPLIVLALLKAAAHADPGTISGHVDAVSGGKPAAAPEGGLWVWLVDKNHREHQKPVARAIQQKNTSFEPHVLVVMKGTEIDFPNKDNELHNVFSPDPYFDLDRVGPGKGKTHKFDAAGAEVEVYCDIHKCMWARVKIVDVLRPEYIQQVDAKGNYKFDNLQPGTYEVYAWAVASKEVASGPLVIRAKDPEAITAKDLHVQLGKLDGKHLNKLGQPYGPSSQYQGRCP